MEPESSELSYFAEIAFKQAFNVECLFIWSEQYHDRGRSLSACFACIHLLRDGLCTALPVQMICYIINQQTQLAQGYQPDDDDAC